MVGPTEHRSQPSSKPSTLGTNLIYAGTLISSTFQNYKVLPFRGLDKNITNEPFSMGQVWQADFECKRKAVPNIGLCATGG